MVEKDEERVLPRIKVSKKVLANQCLPQQLSLSVPKAGLSTQRCYLAFSSELCPWPRNIPIKSCSTCLGAGGPHIHSFPPFPGQPLKGSLSLLPLPAEKSSDSEKSALRGQEFHFPLEQGSKAKENHSKTVPECLQLWLPAPSGSSGLGRLCHIPPKFCSFLLPTPLGPLGFQKSRKSKKARRKAVAS